MQGAAFHPRCSAWPMEGDTAKLTNAYTLKMRPTDVGPTPLLSASAGH
jgi:hypothetical protein